MKKNNILRKNWQFQNIVQMNNKVINQFFVAYSIESKAEFRIGISISKKMANAVYRNRYRRQMRSIIDTVDFSDVNKDIVLILRKPFLKLSYKEKHNQFTKFFERIKNGK